MAQENVSHKDFVGLFAILAFLLPYIKVVECFIKEIHLAWEQVAFIKVFKVISLKLISFIYSPLTLYLLRFKYFIIKIKANFLEEVVFIDYSLVTTFLVSFTFITINMAFSQAFNIKEFFIVFHLELDLYHIWILLALIKILIKKGPSIQDLINGDSFKVLPSYFIGRDILVKHFLVNIFN